MKKSVSYIAILILLSINLMAQNPSSNTQSNSKEKISEIQNNDENLIKQGSDTLKIDKQENKQKNKNDVFIDKDGDGINDNRCNGLKMNKGKGNGMGMGCGKGKRFGKK